MNKKLLIILSDNISVYVKKGEVVPRYYNPGNYFDEVHFLLLNNDNPEPKLIQPLVGDAEIFIYNHAPPNNFLKKTLIYQPILMRTWAQQAIKKINFIPDAIRTYGIHINAYIATQFKRHFKSPILLSLHGNPDVDYYRGRLGNTLKKRIIGISEKYLERYCLKHTDHVIAVYSPILPYLKKNKVKSYSLVYNTVALNAKRKSNYELDKKRVNLLCVGRQNHSQKDPSNIIRAVSELNNTYLHIIGDGDLNDNLVALAQELKCSDRVKFTKAMPNSQICELMHQMDMYIYHSLNYEISKSCIEASLVGLPVILNNRNANPSQELIDAKFILVEDSAQGYKCAIEKVISNDSFRKETAMYSHRFAVNNWDPSLMESKLVKLYETLLPKKEEAL